MKFIKKAAALLFFVTLAMGVMAISASANDFGMTLEKGTDDQGIAIVEAGKAVDYKSGQKVVYNVLLKGTGTINALQFAVSKPTGLSLEGVKINGHAITESNGKYKYLSQTYTGDSPIDLSNSGTTGVVVAELTYTTTNVTALTPAAITVSSASTHEETVTTGDDINTDNASVTVNVHPTYTVKTATYDAETTGVLKTTAEAAEAAFTYEIGDAASATTKITAATAPNAYYTFAGWKLPAGNATATGNNWGGDDIVTTEDYTVSNINTKYGDITLTADFAPVPYTVTYTMNGGTFTTDPTNLTASGTDNVYNYNIETTGIKLGVAEKTGYTFDGWTLASNIGNWTAGDLLGTTEYANMHDNIALSAKFTADSYTATFDANDNDYVGSASGDFANKTYYVTDVNSFPANPTLTGYTFKGWQITSGWEGSDSEIRYGTSTNDVALTAFTAGTTHIGAVAFKATWEAIDYTVAYENGKADGTHGDVTNDNSGGNYTIASVAFTPTDPTRVGYPAFLGWEVTSDDDGSWKRGDIYVTGTAGEGQKAFPANPYGNVTFTAKWDDPTEYTATFDPDNGGAASEDKYTIEGGLAAPSTAPTKTGYTFTGWQVDNAVGSWNKDDAFSSAAGSWGAVTFKAQWDLDFYKMTFNPGKDANGNTLTDATITGESAGAEKEVQYTYTDSSSLNDVIVTRPGYKFTGWSITGSEGSWTSTAQTIGASTTTEGAGTFVATNSYTGAGVAVAQWEIIGTITAVNYKFANTQLILLAVPNGTVTSGGYQYDGKPMYTTDKYNSLFDNGVTVYATLAEQKTTDALMKAVVVYSADYTTVAVGYDPLDVDTQNGVGVGDYGVAGTIYTNSSSYGDDIPIQKRLRMNSTGNSANDYYGVLGDLEAIMNAAT